MTILPPSGGVHLPRIPDSDDEQVDWSAVEAAGLDFCERCNRETADTARPPRSP